MYLKEVVYIENKEIIIVALNYYDNKPKLDFVDCLLCAYKEIEQVDIFSFDKKLNNVLMR